MSVNCHAKMPMTDTDRVSKQPPQLGVYDIEVDVDSDGTAYITSTWDNEEFFTNYDGPPKTENQHALHDGWWADGKIRTATWNAPYTHAGDPPRSLMLTAAMVKDGNLLVAVTLQYVSVPTSQIATYTKKNEDLAYAMINGLKPEFHTE